MPVTLADLLGSVVDLAGKRVLLKVTCPFTESHGAAVLFDIDQVAKFEDHGKWCLFVELGRISITQAANVSSKFDARGLHSEADPEIRRSRFSGILDRPEHSRDTSFPKASGNKDRVIILQLVLVIVFDQILRFDPGHIHSKVVCDAGMGQCLSKRLVRILKFDILADDRDPDRTSGRLFNGRDQIAPSTKISVGKLFL